MIRTDMERMDWLADHLMLVTKAKMFGELPHCMVMWYDEHPDGEAQYSFGDTFRDAVDKAMEGK